VHSVFPWLTKTARIVSVVGHPLVTTSILTLYVAFNQVAFFNALFVSALLLGGVILPVSWQNYRRTQQGQYTNFDVSDRQQRYRFYPVLMGLLALVTGLLFVTGQPRSFCYGFLSMLLLIGCSYLINFFSKASLHTSISIFIAWAVLLISQPMALVMMLFALVVTASRLVLNRHYLSELVIGALLGLLVGAGFYTFMRLAL
jgi:membrane-associated phospholipid phosphatase